MSQIYNRQTKEYTENSQYGGGMLNILYNHMFGRFLLKFVVHPYFSKVGGLYYSSFISKSKIRPFVRNNHINMDDFEKVKYRSFADFFIRHIKPDRRPVDMNPSSLISPADSKLSVYSIEKENRITIKGVSYTLTELVSGMVSLGDYEGGKCLVFRLAMDDYHRYSFIDKGKMVKKYLVKGRLHTVSSISKDYSIYRENTRVVNLMKTQNFGSVICIEVGALLVGRMHNHDVTIFSKGQEKGYFELGGSTIVYLFKPNRIELDEDIVANANEDTEIKLRVGEKIGRSIYRKKA